MRCIGAKVETGATVPRYALKSEVLRSRAISHTSGKEVLLWNVIGVRTPSHHEAIKVSASYEKIGRASCRERVF